MWMLCMPCVGCSQRIMFRHIFTFHNLANQINSGCTLRTHLRDTGVAVETLVEFHKEQTGKSSASPSWPISSRIHVPYWYYLARANQNQWRWGERRWVMYNHWVWRYFREWCRRAGFHFYKGRSQWGEQSKGQCKWGWRQLFILSNP